MGWQSVEKLGNAVFWIVFIVFGAVIIAGSRDILTVWILFGLTIVAIGLHRLVEELRKKRLEFSFGEIANGFRALSSEFSGHMEWNETAHSKHDVRFFNLDGKRATLDQKIEKNHRDIVRKIIDVENNMNVLKKQVKK